MDTYLPALLLLSGGAFINTRSNVPELRPASDVADTVWKLMAKLAFFLWLGLLLWGVYMRPWTAVATGLILSMLFNLLLASRGPRSIWPGLSMGFCAAGLALGVYTVLG